MASKLTLLVLCTGNSARSQMAEAFFKKYGDDRFDVRSAGTDPKGVNPLTVRVMNEIGIDLSNARSKHLDEFLGHWPVQILFIVCHDADASCPVVWPGVLERHFWPFEDPAKAEGSEEQRLEVFRRVRDEMNEKIKIVGSIIASRVYAGNKDSREETVKGQVQSGINVPRETDAVFF